MWEDLTDELVVFAIIVKVCFLAFAVLHVLAVRSPLVPDKYDATFVYWEERAEFLFYASVAVLLIVNFSGKTQPVLGPETRFLFWALGWVILVSADWGLFLSQAWWHDLITAKYINHA